ncbi:HAD family acid phosphatase [Microbacterium sp. ZW T5_56]|uniref:phosphatase domain-containing protein n=1 Tax=Microbacterium sp. ZW T5_56 TaxID=3378081 RepID=UPI00385265DC
MGDATRTGVIVDVDGTLCDVSGVRHYVSGEHGHRNFDAFHRASALCPPVLETLAWTNARRAEGHTVFIVTARRQRWEYLTRVWLRKWEVSYEHLLMRGDTDDRVDVHVKAEILQTIRDRGFRIVAAIDDNPSVIELWRAEGIPVTIVPGWPGEIEPEFREA